MGFEDIADDTPEVQIAGDGGLLAAIYRFENTEEVDADELTDEGEFPQFGQFMETTEFSIHGDKRRRVYMEVPAGLAEWCVQNGIEEGDSIYVEDYEMDDGRYRFSVRRVADPADGVTGDSET